MSRPEPYPFEFIAPPPVEPATRERAVQATADLGSAAGSVIDVAAAGVEVAVRSGEAVAAGCDLLGLLFEGLFGLLAGLLR